MKTIQFKCTLLSDVILNVRSASEGNQNTLDFIPGNCFLGIVAKKYSSCSIADQQALFHDGTVRYGDAHPIVGDGESVLQRTLRIPASFYYPKLKKLEETCYIHHYYNRCEDHEGLNGGPQQLKQCRKGFYRMADGVATLAPSTVNFAIKSAYDRHQRRALDEQMYGYESLGEGGVFLFEVETDKDDLAGFLVESLKGKHRIGRSRSAQYGMVAIEDTDFSQPESHVGVSKIKDEKKVVVYADGRLIFTDAEGQPTFRPTASDFGVKGSIDWAQTQIRTFQYAPWNFTRQTRDTDRCGIEKGSVIVITADECPEELPTYVGSYCHEGFGKVIFNPDFLEPEASTNGRTCYQFAKNEQETEGSSPSANLDDAPRNTPLLSFLVNSKKQELATSYIYGKVNEFADKNQSQFNSDLFASQWGAIRAIAMRCADIGQLRYELFERTVTVHHSPTPTDPIDEDREMPTAYLSHGVAKEKWEKGTNRVNLLKAFIDEVERKERELGVRMAVEAVVNLASEMAKISKKK